MRVAPASSSASSWSWGFWSVVLTRAYPITATTARFLSHNPVEFSVLILPVMTLVFETSDRAAAPGRGRADERDFAVASNDPFSRRGQRPAEQSGCGAGRALRTHPRDLHQHASRSYSVRPC